MTCRKKDMNNRFMSKDANILIVNKPLGWTSNDVVRKIKGRLGGLKVGHAGTLDPLATGVLIVLIGGANKRQHEFMKLPKEYVAEFTFGEERDTYDVQGGIVHKASPDQLVQLTREKIEKALEGFRGVIVQKVPPFSAVKVKGQRLYQLARKGKVSPEMLPEKEVSIYQLELLDFTPYSGESLPTAELRIFCSCGTYVRSLAHDLGRELGVGGYVSRITRTRVGEYNLNEAQEIDEI